MSIDNNISLLDFIPIPPEIGKVVAQEGEKRLFGTLNYTISLVVGGLNCAFWIYSETTIFMKTIVAVLGLLVVLYLIAVAIKPRALFTVGTEGLFVCNYKKKKKQITSQQIYMNNELMINDK